MRLREYQLNSIYECLVAYQKGSNSVLLQLPTGSGKTLSALALADSLISGGDRVLWICHRKTLIDQAKEARKRLALDSSKFVFMTDKLAAKKVKRGDYALTIFDEAHRSANATQQAVWGNSTRMLGLSATPIRLDKTPLDDQYDQIVYGVRPHKLISEGSLSHYVIEGNSEFDRTALSITEYDTDSQIVKKCKLAISPEQVLSEYLKHATPANHVMIFVSDIEFCESLTKLLLGVGARAVQAHSKDPASDANITAFASGKARVLVNVDIATEGFDVPSVDLVICARVTSSLSLWIQIVGRVLRPHPEKEIGRVVDITDNYRVFGIHNGVDIDDIDWRSYMEVHNKKSDSSAIGDMPSSSTTEKEPNAEIRDVGVEIFVAASSGLHLDDLAGISPARANEIQLWLSERIGWDNCDRRWLLDAAASLGEDYVRIIKRRLGIQN